MWTDESGEKRRKQKGREKEVFLVMARQTVNSKCIHSDCQLIHLGQTESRLLARQMDDLSIHPIAIKSLS